MTESESLPNEQKPKKAKKQSRGERLQNAAQEVINSVEQARADFETALEAYRSALDELHESLSHIEDALSNLQEIRSEYEQWYDNLPDGLKESPVGEKLSILNEIDLQHDVPELSEPEEPDFSYIENAAQEILDAELPLGFGRD
jgi:chromosome segregation ATPase